jgi:4-hydroxybutyryl-CoA dehydratase/vinylacetyl-CoA-Delta-isomerase
MALKTPKQYIESLQDGREVWVDGEKVVDIASHSRFKAAIEHLAFTYEMALNPEQASHCVTTCPETGETITGCYRLPANSDDLKARRETIYHSCLYAGGYIPFGSVKEIGTDALFALRMVCPDVDKKYGTSYFERVKNYHHFCQKNDLSLAGAVTDPKGDRALRPHEQPHLETYLRIVEKRQDGIVVKGAKVHITSAPMVNEMLVMPTRAMGKGDEDWAVAFAVPANAPGLKMIANPDYTPHDAFEFPLSAPHPIIHAMVIFDNVFIPTERIFLCGEVEFAGDLAVTFAAWHRFTGLCYKGPVAELMLGAATLIADYNGVAKASHIKDKLREMIMYIESIRTYSMMAAYEPQYRNGLAMPNQMCCNVGKYLFASGFHQNLRCLQEIAGGIAATCPSSIDYSTPELKDYIDYYLVGRKGISTENRIRMLKLVRDLTGSSELGVHMYGTVHGEGTLEAQRMMMLRGYDSEPAMALARKVAGIKE